MEGTGGPRSLSPQPAKLSLDMFLASLVIAVVAYLLGSLPAGYLLVRIFRHQDIRSVGSGNIGATNVLRLGGKGLGAATFLIDMLKGSAAVWLGALLGSHLTHAANLSNFQAIAALFAVLGHLYPVWLDFRGGKGVATGFGVFLVASSSAALAAIAVFALVLVLSRFVSVASILGSASFPLFAYLFSESARTPLLIGVEFTVALLIIAKHHQNIRRLFAGTEARLGARKHA